MKSMSVEQINKLISVVSCVVKKIIAKGGRYDELVRFFNPNEKICNGIGFTIFIDNLRELLVENTQSKKRVF